MKTGDAEPLNLTDITSAREFLRKKYVSSGFEVEADSNEGLVVSLQGKGQVTLKKEEIGEYMESSQQFGSFNRTPNECSICNKGYREQLVEEIRGRFPTLSFYAFRRRGRRIMFGRPEVGIFAEIGSASPLYRSYFRFEESVLESLKRSLESPFDLEYRRDFLQTAVTVRIQNIEAETVQLAAERTNQLIESLMFSMSYLMNLPFNVVTSWPSRRPSEPRPERFRFSERVSGDHLPLPTASYNPDMTGYYQLGLSADDPILKFLAFYQILEYQFLTVSDEVLYQKLQQRLRDPKFTGSPKHLDKIIQDVLDYRRELEQEELLKKVLNKFVDADELIDFISKYESHLGENIYTKHRNLFGMDLKVNLEKGHVISNVATVITTVRNALVHSSDRYERNERYVPFSKSTEIVRKEIPIMKFLAEKAIIGSAQELPESVTRLNHGA